MALGTPYFIGSGISSTINSTLTFTVTNSSTAGDCLIAGVTVLSSASSVISNVTDSKSNSYTAVTGTVPGGAYDSEMWVCLNSAAALAGGTDTVTVTLTANLQFKVGCIIGCSGVAATSAVDQAAAAFLSAGSTAPSVTSGATTQASELAVAWETNNSTPTISWGGAWTQQQGGISNLSESAMATQVLTSTGTVTASGTLSSSAKWVISVLTLKAASGGSSVTGNGAMTLGLGLAGTGSLAAPITSTGAMTLGLGLAGAAHQVTLHSYLPGGPQPAPGSVLGFTNGTALNGLLAYAVQSPHVLPAAGTPPGIAVLYETGGPGGALMVTEQAVVP